MNFTSVDFFPKFLYAADLEMLHDALIDYPSGANLSGSQKIAVINEIALRAIWAE